MENLLNIPVMKTVGNVIMLLNKRILSKDLLYTRPYLDASGLKKCRFPECIGKENNCLMSK